MRKKFNLGKIDYNGNGRKNNAVDVECEMKLYKGIWEFAASACVWNNNHSDCITAGQCLDELKKWFSDNFQFMEIWKLWKKYHLNTLHAGTIEQMYYLRKNNVPKDYNKEVEALREVDLYEVQLEDGSSYRYGEGWIAYGIPANDLEKIRLLMDMSKEEIAKEDRSGKCVRVC